MKGDFVVKFIKIVIESGKDLHNMWHWTPLYYKGWRVKGYPRRKIYTGLKNLKNRGLLNEFQNGNYVFTKKGKKWFNDSVFRYHINREKKWDSKWRVLIFDIPQEFHNKRNIFRQKLKSLGFYMIQKSVFVYPYPCEEELSHYCGRLEIGDYINVIKADNLGFIENEVRNFFGL